MTICLLFKSNGQKRASLDILSSMDDSCLCPVTAYKNILSLIPAQDSDPVFCINSDKGRLIPITYSKFQKKLKYMISKTGRNCNLFSSHSLCRGGCSWAFKSHVNSELIQHHGDWLSDAYKQYLSYDFEQKLSVSQLMVGSEVLVIITYIVT